MKQVRILVLIIPEYNVLYFLKQNVVLELLLVKWIFNISSCLIYDQALLFYLSAESLFIFDWLTYLHVYEREVYRKQSTQWHAWPIATVNSFDPSFAL